MMHFLADESFGTCTCTHLSAPCRNAASGSSLMSPPRRDFVSLYILNAMMGMFRHSHFYVTVALADVDLVVHLGPGQILY